MLGESVVIKDCEYQRLVKGFAIRYLKIQQENTTRHDISRKCQHIITIHERKAGKVVCILVSSIKISSGPIHVYLLSVVLMEDTVIDNTFAFPPKIYSIWSQFEFNFWMTKIEGNQLNCNFDLQWPQRLRRLRRSKIWIFPPKMAIMARLDSTIGFWRENSNIWPLWPPRSLEAKSNFYLHF